MIEKPTWTCPTCGIPGAVPTGEPGFWEKIQQEDRFIETARLICEDVWQQYAALNPVTDEDHRKHREAVQGYFGTASSL